MNLFQLDEGCFFRDGQRSVDFVIVLKDELDPLLTYINQLEAIGVEFEIATGQIVRKDFLLIHLPKKVLEHFAEIYNIGIAEREITFQREPSYYTFSYSTPITYIPTKEPGTFTNTERIAILSKLLENARYGAGKNQRGLSKLIQVNLIEDAYPLHDGPIDDDILEYTNDRQLLFHYWSKLGVWNKEMPLDMIKRYFGSEIAFYFAWLEFFNFMLIPAAIIGTLITVLNLIISATFHIQTVDDVCNANNMVICPTCKFGKYCKFEKFTSFCSVGRWNHIFDNRATVGFAIFMSFWAICFMKWWKRKETKLKFRWDVGYFGNPVVTSRQKFNYIIRGNKMNIVSEQLEAIVPKYITALRVMISVCICVFMFSLIFVGLFGVTLYELIITIKMGRMTALVTAALLQIMFIQFFSMIYRKLSTILAKFEDVRTKPNYGNSFLFTRYLLTFVNNYAAFLYIVFVKGRFFTVPNRFKYDYFIIFEKDTCQPFTCIMRLSIMLLFFLLLKRFAKNVVMFLIPNWRRHFLKLRFKHRSGTMPQYEEEYMLSTDKFLQINRFCDMVTEYGLMISFVAALPLAPMCVLLNNLLDARVHANHLVTRYRRPVPRKMGGIGAWNEILLGLTYLSTAMNAVVLAFTSDFVARELYISNNDGRLKGFINSTLSTFSLRDLTETEVFKSNTDICYYRSKRYPPDHRKRYQLTTDYWIEITWRLMFLFIFEHIIMLCYGIISYAISDEPPTIKHQKKVDKQTKINRKRLERLEDFEEYSDREPPSTSHKKKL